MNNMWILAQAPGDQTPSGITSEPVTEQGEATTSVPSDPNAAAPVTQERKSFGGTSLLFLGLMLVVMYLLLFRGPRKKQQQHKQMVQSLQKKRQGPHNRRNYRNRRGHQG